LEYTKNDLKYIKYIAINLWVLERLSILFNKTFEHAYEEKKGWFPNFNVGILMPLVFTFLLE
jgi:hypothetical protein